MLDGYLVPKESFSNSNSDINGNNNAQPQPFAAGFRQLPSSLGQQLPVTARQGNSQTLLDSSRAGGGGAGGGLTGVVGEGGGLTGRAGGGLTATSLEYFNTGGG